MGFTRLWNILESWLLKKSLSVVTIVSSKVKTFHRMMDEQAQEEPIAWDLEGATRKCGFKIEELVEFVRAASNSEEEFQQAVRDLPST